MNWGTFDISGLKELQRKLNKLSTNDTHKFMESCIKELAARLLRSAKQMTPVGQYPNNSGKKGGTLRRSWTTDKVGAADNKAVSDWADSADISVTGGVYTIDVINPVEYASYVEYGHRTKSGGLVPGHFMLKISEDELKAATPQLLENRISNFFKI